jgi:hypothetical protein
MKKTRNRIGWAALCALVCAWGSRAPAQQQVDWTATEASNWNVDANWSTTLVPEGQYNESVGIGNGGTAFVNSAVPSVLGLGVSNGLLQIQNAGDLQIEGNASIGGKGRIELTGGAEFSVTGNLANAGVLSLTGPSVSLDIDGNFSNSGTLAAVITGASHSAIAVGGKASLSGELELTFDGVTPALGQSWQIVSAESVTPFGSISVNGPALDRGLQFQGKYTASTASVGIGNTLILSVDRVSGNASLSNVIGNALVIDGYSIESDSGLLTNNTWSSLTTSGLAGAGWRTAAPSTKGLSELNLTGGYSLGVGASVSLGKLYAGGPVKPLDEDLTFSFTTADGQLFEGIVEYTGPANDLVLVIDPTTGEAAIRNLSGLVSPFTIDGYSITSASGALEPTTWTSFADTSAAGAGWREAAPTATGLSELNLTSSTLFSTGKLVSLGKIFDPAASRDLVFEYSTQAGALMFGTVEYGTIDLAPTLLGDANSDGKVDLTDFGILKSNFGTGTSLAQGDFNGDSKIDLTDFGILKDNFGKTGSTAVPEPTTWSLLSLGLLGLALRARRRVAG